MPGINDMLGQPGYTIEEIAGRDAQEVLDIYQRWTSILGVAELAITGEQRELAEQLQSLALQLVGVGRELGGVEPYVPEES